VKKVIIICISAAVLIIVIGLSVFNGPQLIPYIHSLFQVSNVSSECYMYSCDESGALPSAEYLSESKERGTYIDLRVPKDQPLKEFGIEVMADNKTGEKYLYTRNVPDINNIGEDTYIFMCRAAVNENSEKDYLAYDARDFRNVWALLGVRKGVFVTLVIRSPLPPIPGCYFTTNHVLKYPSDLFVAARTYYPHITLSEKTLIQTKLILEKIENE
jgi:hypothetical protein